VPSTSLDESQFRTLRHHNRKLSLRSLPSTTISFLSTLLLFRHPNLTIGRRLTPRRLDARLAYSFNRIDLQPTCRPGVLHQNLPNLAHQQRAQAFSQFLNQLLIIFEKLPLASLRNPNQQLHPPVGNQSYSLHLSQIQILIVLVSFPDLLFDHRHRLVLKIENIPVSNKTISKPRKAKKGKKPRTKWHCNICGLRHFSSEKQLCDHKGSFRCQARTHRDNPFRCRKCGLKCDNVVNYHRHKEARCYKNTSK